ncbi:MAG: hypothetical protein U9O84_04765 [Chloroflexota bacterium]|nr:hypothetical protein [Chloroflexota bacterium]
MANIRCREEHSQSLIENARRREYVACVEPLNYPNTDVICGTIGCPRPGLVHLDEEEWLAYQQENRRIFDLFETSAVKFRVGENAETIERHNDGTISFRSWRRR